MAAKSKQPKIPLPKSWNTHVTSGILHIMALAQYALTYSRSWGSGPLPRRTPPGHHHRRSHPQGSAVPPTAEERGTVPLRRPGEAVLLPGLQGLVPGERAPAAVRDGGPPWQHRGGGTLHPDGPQVLVQGKPGVPIELAVSYQHGRKHLPVVTVRRAA